jgi:hypothetical protein
MLRAKLTYANVVASIAVFVALGGTSYAAFALPAGSVGSKQLKNGAVTLVKVSRSAISTLHGATGARGLTGAQGLPGNRGPKGDTGAVGPTWGDSQGGTPPASPDLATGTFDVNVPANGHLLVLAQWKALQNYCSSGFTCDVDYGLYLDGQPIANSSHEVGIASTTTDISEWSFGAVVPITAGSHQLMVSGAVVNGATVGGFGGGDVTMQAVLLG